MVDTDKSYARDDAFWEKYIKGRPKIPEAFFQRITDYHASHGGQFGVAHDIGAGVGIHSPRLARYFQHIIISDVVARNVQLAEQRLGEGGEGGKYRYREARMEDASGLDEGSVDFVFASFAMHFAHFDEAFAAFGKQLKPGGTFAALISSTPILSDPAANDVWHRMWERGSDIILKHSTDRRDRLRTFGNASSGYDTMPLPEKWFRPGALRVSLNTKGAKTWPPMISAELQKEYEDEFGPFNAGVGPNDRIVVSEEAGWSFTADMQTLRDQVASMPWNSLEPGAQDAYWKELEAVWPKDKIVEGIFPARIILATRR